MVFDVRQRTEFVPFGVHLDAESVQFVVDLLNKDLQHEGVLSRFVYRFCGLEW